MLPVYVFQLAWVATWSLPEPQENMIYTETQPVIREILPSS